MLDELLGEFGIWQLPERLEKNIEIQYGEERWKWIHRVLPVAAVVMKLQAFRIKVVLPKASSLTRPSSADAFLDILS